MKQVGLIIGALVFSGSVFADEIATINGLVKEVSKLRTNYDNCQVALHRCRQNLQPQQQSSQCDQKLQEAQQQVELLKEQLETTVVTDKNESSTQEQHLEEQVKHLKEEIASKNEEIVQLKEQLKQEKAKKKVLQQHVDEYLKTQKKYALKSQKQNITIITPSAYRTSKDAEIYNGINGKVIDKWEKGTSFTSYINADDWIKITGYFVDRKWRKAQKDLWIKKSDAFKR